MKTVKNYLFILLAFSCANFSFGQIVGQFRDWRDMADINMINNELGEQIDLSKTTGSPYLNPTYQKGFVTNLDKNEDLPLWLRYNVFSDNIEAKLELKSLEVAVLDRSKKYEFTIMGEKFVLVQDKAVFESKGSDNGYMAQLSDADKKVILYKNYTHDYTPPIKAQTSYDVDRPGNLKIESDYYMKFENQPLVLLEAHKRKIADAFPSEYQDDIESFVKKEKLKFKGDDKEVETDLRSVINYFNSILQNS